MEITQSIGRHKISRLQFAVGSDWERCLIVTGAAESGAVSAWFDRASGRQIAAELFFDAPEYGMSDAFAGLRTPVSASVAAFYREAALLMLTRKLRLAELFAAAPFEISFDSDKIEFMELGAVNRWNSFGPLKFWTAAQGDPRQALSAALVANGRYLASMSVPAAVELSFGGSPQKWLGLPVSERREDGTYILQLEKALSAAILFMSAN